MNYLRLLLFGLISTGVYASNEPTPPVMASGFESPSTGNFVYWASMSAAERTALGWTGSGNVQWGGPALFKNGSGWGFSNVPEGVQAISLQSNSAISRTIDFPAAGNYRVRWQHASRGGQINPYVIQLDGADVSTDFSTSNATWSSAECLFEVFEAGEHVLSFSARTQAGVDQSVAIDDVRVESMPPVVIVTQPAALQLILTGETTNLSVVVEELPVPSFQWYRRSPGGEPESIAGATSSDFTTPELTTDTEFWVRITNERGSIDSAVGLVRVFPNAAYLIDLAVSDGTLAPSFGSTTLAYEASVPFRTASIRVIPRVAFAGTTLQVGINGGNWVPAVTAQATAELPLNVGANSVEVRLESTVGAINTYTINITRAAESDDPVYRYDFNSDGLLPLPSLFNNTGQPVSSLMTVAGGNLRQRALNVNGNISFNFPDASGFGGGFSFTKASFVEARLKVLGVSGVGGAFLTIEDGSYQYSAMFVSSGIYVGTYTADPSRFVAVNTSEFHTYRIESPPNSNIIRFFVDGVFRLSTTATASNYNYFGWGDGFSQSGVDANVDWDYVEFGQDSNYDPQFNGSVQGLSLGGATLSPAFDEGTLVYEASVTNQTESVSLTGVLGSQTSATVNGLAIASEIPSANITLGVGKNILTVTATGPNGITRNYTVVVSRGSDSPPPSGTLIGADAVFAHDFEELSGNLLQPMVGPAVSLPSALVRSTHAGALPSGLGFSPIHLVAPMEVIHSPLDTGVRQETATPELSFSIFYNDRGYNHFNNTSGNYTRLLTTYRGSGQINPDEMTFGIVSGVSSWWQANLQVVINQVPIQSPAIIPYGDGKWHQAGFVFKNGEVQFYYDGMPLGASQKLIGAPMIPAQLENWRLIEDAGSSGKPDEYFPGGYYDEAALWARALSESEMRGLFQAGLRSVAVPASDAAHASNADQSYGLVQSFGSPKPYGKPWFWDSGTFATGMAIAGKYLAIGAPVDDSADFLNGVVHVYDLSSTSLGEPFLSIPNPVPGFRSGFGWIISSSGTRIAVTSGDRVLVFDLAGSTPSTPEFNLGPVSPSALSFQWPLLAVGDSSAGQARIYNLESLTPGTALHVLSHPQPIVGGGFGRSVALHGNRVAVGSSAPGTGTVCLFDLAGPTPLVADVVITTPMAESAFGQTLAISERFLAVGASNAANNWGTVSLYDLEGGDVTRPRAILRDFNPQQSVLTASYFGATLALDGNLLAISSGPSDGRRASVLVHDLSRKDVWTPVARLSSPTGDGQNQFGASIAINGNSVFVGATRATRQFYQAGAVYAFDVEPFSMFERELLTGGSSEVADVHGWVPLPGFTGLTSAASTAVPATGLGPNQTLGSTIVMSSSNSLGQHANPQQSYQDVNLGMAADLIDSGRLRYTFQALLQGRVESGLTSNAEIDLIFLDSDGEPVSQLSFNDTDVTLPDWETVEDFGKIPAGSRVVRVVLRTSRSGGFRPFYQMSAFDNISFMVTTSPVLRRIDLDASVHRSSASAYELTLDPGRYRLRPIPRGRFQAWHGWGGSAGNDSDGDMTGDSYKQGWEWSYLLQRPASGPRLVRASILGMFRDEERAFEVNASAQEFLVTVPEVIRLFIPTPNTIPGAGGVSLALEQLADQDDSLAHAVGPVSYRSSADSPFASVGFGTGNFEHRPGNLVSGSGVSVEETESSFVRIQFDQVALGYLPTHAGIVWAGTSAPNGVTVEYFNSDGLLVATQGPALMTLERGPHFFGAVYRGGIQSFTVSAPGGSLLLTDLQFGFAGESSTPPENEPVFAANPGVLRVGQVNAAVNLPSGGRVVGGTFAVVDGEERDGLARFDTDGHLIPWKPLAAGLPSAVRSLAVHDDWLFVGGTGGVSLAVVSLTDPSAIRSLPLSDEVVDLAVIGDSLFVASADQVRRFDLSGEQLAEITELDWSGLPPWIGAPGEEIRTILPFGSHLLIGGSFSTLGGVTCNGLARIDSSGSVDSVWLADLGSNPFEVSQLVPGASGFHVLGSGGEIRRLLDNGNIDPAWTPLTDSMVLSIAAASSGIHLGGSDGRIRLYQGSGSPTTSLTTNGSVLFLHSDGGRLHGFGSFNIAGTHEALGWVMLDGAVATPGPSIAMTGEILCMARQPDGKLLIGGDFHWVEGRAVHGLARLLSGTDRLDVAWRPVFAGGPVKAIAIAGDEIFVGGNFTMADGLTGSLAKYELFEDGEPVATWNPEVEQVTTIATSRDHVFVAGNYDGTIGLRQISRTGGVIDPAWGPVMANQNGAVEILTLGLHGEHLYLGGRFTSVGPLATRSGLARLTLATGIADDWNPNLFVSANEAPEVRALHFQGDLLHIAGTFSNIQGTVQPNLARMSVKGLFAGAVDSSWSPVVNEPLRSMIAIGENLFVAGNHLFTVKTNAASAVARQLETADGPIHALSFDNGRIIAGGAFVSFGAKRTPAFAATPYLGSPRVTFRDGRLYIYPDDGTGPFIEAFEITGLIGGVLVDPVTLQQVTGLISVEAGAAGLVWVPAVEGAEPRVTVAAIPPTGLNSPDLNPVTTDLSVNPSTPQFRFDRTDMQVYEGDLFNGFVNFTGTLAQLGTVAYEIMPGTARRFDGTTGDYVNVIQPLRFEWNPQGGVFQAPLRIPVLEDGIVEGAEEFYIRLVQPSSGLALGSGNLLRVRIIDGARASGTGAPASVLDPLRTAVPNPVLPLATGSVKVNLPPPVEGGTWRLWGDAFWRDSMSVAGNLQNNIFHHIDYRPAAGYAELLNSRQYVQAGPAQAQIVRTYETIDPGFPVADGSLKVLFSPPSVTAGAQWRLVGGNDWHDSGEVIALPPGNHLIEFRSDIVGWTPPAPRPVGIATGHPLVVRASYIPVRTPGNPLAPVSFTGMDPATAAPYHCVGQIETNFGFATGTAVSEQTVLTAARVLWNPDTLTVASRAAWLHQKDPVHYRPAPRNPRGVFILSGYAQQLATDAQNGTGTNSTGNLPSDNLDVAVAYFAGITVARNGYSGFLADYSPVSGFNPWLLGTAPKRLVGYPMVGVNAVGAMHSASFAVAMQPVQNQVFASPEVGGLPGMEGSPLFSFHPGRNRYYPAAIYLGENGGARFRALDGNVAELIYRAEYIAAILNYNGGTGGGDEFQNNLSEDDFPIGFVQVEIPLGIGRWRIIDGAGNPVTVWFEGGESAPVIPGLWRVQFEQVAGLATPDPVAVEVQSSLFAPVITGNYPLTAEVWAAGFFDESELADDSVSGPSADPDNDGIVNLLEFAFGLAPEIGRRSDYVAGSETPGMPLVTLDRGTPIPALRVEFLRRKASFAPELDYIVEFAESPAGGWNRALPATITVEELIENPTWERVIAQVPTGSEGKQFTRVRVDLIPLATAPTP